MVLDTVQEIDIGGAERVPGARAALRIGASIGITSYEPAATPVPASAEELIEQADAAMYSAKKAGKGCYRYSPEHLAAALVSDGQHQDRSDEQQSADAPKGTPLP